MLMVELAQHAHRAFQVAAPCWPCCSPFGSAPPTRSARRGGRSCCTSWCWPVIAAVAWLVAALLVVLEDAALARCRTDVPDNRWRAGSRRRW